MALADLPDSRVVAELRGALAPHGDGAATPDTPPLRELAFGQRRQASSQKIYALERSSSQGTTSAGELRYRTGLADDPVRAYFVARVGGRALEGWETRALPELWQFAVDGRPVGSMQERIRPRKEAASLRQRARALCCSTTVWAVHDPERRRGLVRVQYPVDRSEPFLFYRTRDRQRLLICVAWRPDHIAAGLEQRLRQQSHGQLLPFQAGQDDLIIPPENPSTHPADELLLFLLNIVFRVHVFTLDFSLS